jgi:membrane-associated phospholipid phosphatase
MRRRNGVAGTIILLSINILALRAQSDAPLILSPDTVAPAPQVPPVNFRFLSSAPYYKPKVAAIIVPGAMIAYGFLALGNNTFKDLNDHTKGELREDHPTFSNHIDNYLQYAPAAAVYGLNAIGIHGKHNLRDRSMLYGMSMLMMSGTVFVTKRLSHEERPDQSDFYSFPSGHTASAFAAAEFMRKEYSEVSPWYGYAGYAMATATGALRLYNNKHWLSDVIAGAGFGILSTKAAYWVYPWVKHQLFKDKPASTLVLPYYNPQWHSAGLSLSMTLQH